jgi:hypothetical protein
MQEHFYQQAAPYVAHGALAIFGALVHATKVYRAGGTKNFLDYIALVFMSSFSGVMFLLLALQWFGAESYLTGAMAGAGGFIGVEGMTLVIDYLTRYFKR